MSHNGTEFSPADKILITRVVTANVTAAQEVSGSFNYV